MSVYTAYDMVGDCRAGKPDGWRWFARNLAPPLRILLAHYAGGEPDAALRRLMDTLRRDLAAMQPAPIRELIVALRPTILHAAGYPRERPGTPVELATVTDAFEPLTFAERQIVWLDTMSYDVADTARFMRASPETVDGVRKRAGELLRSKLDEWTASLLRDSGLSLQEEVRRATPEDPVATRDYMDLVDGRVTWQRRGEIERKLAASWFEIDHVCRVREVDEAVTKGRPLDDKAAAPYYAMLGVQPPKRPAWKRIFS